MSLHRTLQSVICIAKNGEYFGLMSPLLFEILLGLVFIEVRDISSGYLALISAAFYFECYRRLRLLSL